MCGIALIAAGASPAAAFVMSLVFVSGASQLVAAQLIAVGAPIAVIFLSCFVVGLRLMMYSAAMAPHLRGMSAPWRRVIAFFLTDQMFAAAMPRFAADPNPAGTRWYLLGGGLIMYAAWQAANLAGIVLGAVLPEEWSLDFVIPLSFLGLVVPQLRDRATIAAVLAAGVAAVALDSMPLKLSLILAGTIGIAAGASAEAVHRRIADRRT